MLNVSTIIEAFTARYNERPELMVRAPGRAGLIGDQIDYTEGLALAVAIDRATYVAASRRVDRLVRIYSRQFDAEDRFALDTIERSEARPWANYVRGVTRGFIARDLPLFGANLLIDSDVPIGSGLSSSAALEVATGYTLQLLNQISLLGEELALLARGAENSFVGRPCGILDQLTAALGQEGHALLVDCRDLSYRPIPFPATVRLVICDSGTHHPAASPISSERGEECAEAVRRLRPLVGGHLGSLRDLGAEDLARYGAQLPPQLLARARHVLGENRRAIAAADALEAGDIAAMGALMYESHASLRDDYQVSLPEADLLVELAHRQAGCYGARLTGTGGSVVCLVNAPSLETFSLSVGAAYLRESGHEAQITVCRTTDGVRRAGSS